MLAIYKKEIITFFTTMEAYVAISVFFCINGLILWYIPSEFNIFYNKQASLLPFFIIAPWVLLFLIPAITMKMINSELVHKTSLILFTKPITMWEIIIGKFLASFTIGITAIIPTTIFVYTIYNISEPKGNIDSGELLGSYIGIILLIKLYSAIGLFCSSVFKNNMIAFILTTVIILLLYSGIDLIANFYNNTTLEYLSLHYHYKSISRGIIDSRDIIYFISMTFFFLYSSQVIIDKNKT